MRGSWTGFSWGHTRAHFFRAILESIGYEYAYYLRILRALLPDLRLIEARAIGGGAQSGAWNQMKADILGVPYRRVLRAESATWGAALIAGKASGLVPDLVGSALRSAPVSGEVLEPRAGMRPVYDRAFERYLRWQKRLEKGYELDA
jgi:xylulokinase